MLHHLRVSQIGMLQYGLSACAEEVDGFPCHPQRRDHEHRAEGGVPPRWVEEEGVREDADQHDIPDLSLATSLELTI